MTVVCPQCHKRYTPALAKRYPARAARFVDNRSACGYVQDEFPDSTSEEREQLLTGICSSACWEAYLGPEE